MSFVKKVVLVTGASSGIGACVAQKFAKNGAMVSMTGRNYNKLKNISMKCSRYENEPLVTLGDLCVDDDVQKIVDNTIKHFGKLDILVNNAGIIGRATSILHGNAMEHYEVVMSTNFRSIVKLTNLAAPYLVKTRGNIINISSIFALHANSINFPYGSSKAALNHFTKCIAFDLGEKGVRVNCINPGPVRTDIVENMGPDMAMRKDKIFESLKKTTLLNKISEPDEIAELVLYLASEAAGSVTGASVTVDNGAVLKGIR